MKTQHKYTYYVYADVGIVDSKLLIRVNNETGNKEMSATSNEERQGGGWISDNCYNIASSKFRRIAQLQAEVIFPNLTKE